MGLAFDATPAALQSTRLQAAAGQARIDLAGMQQVNGLLDGLQLMMAGVAASPNHPARGRVLNYRARMALQAYQEVAELEPG